MEERFKIAVLIMFIVPVNILILFMTGIFLPMTISTDALPLSLIIIITSIIIGCTLIALYFSIVFTYKLFFIKSE